MNAEMLWRLRKMAKNMEDGYMTHLAYGGKADPDMELDIDTLNFVADLLKRMMNENEDR